MAHLLAVSNPIFGRTNFPIKRTQRYPQYSDDEMRQFFAEIAKGYCVNQSADHCGYDRETVRNTLYSDDEIYAHVLDLSMVAGARIRAGELQAPARYDKLYDEFY